MKGFFTLSFACAFKDESASFHGIVVLFQLLSCCLRGSVFSVENYFAQPHLLSLIDVIVLKGSDALKRRGKNNNIKIGAVAHTRFD